MKTFYATWFDEEEGVREERVMTAENEIQAERLIANDQKIRGKTLNIVPRINEIFVPKIFTVETIE